MLKFAYRFCKRLKKRLRYYYQYINWLGFKRGLFFIRANRMSGRECKIRVPGIKTDLHFRCGTSDVSVMEDTFLRGHYEFGLADEPSVIVDAGAHIGLVTVLFANRYPSCRIIAIEPDLDNFRLLRANTREYRNVDSVNGVLWFEKATLGVENPAGENWAYRFAPSNNGQYQAVTVMQIMEDFGLNRIDLLKIDIEGAEKEVMEHSQGWIGSVGAVSVELHDRFRPGCSRAFSKATQRFPCEVHSGPNTIVSMKELI